MPTPPPVTVNADVLRWARNESGYSVERVGRRLQVPEARVLAWEDGSRQPTTRQLGLLAAFYHRPLGVFFMARPPQMPPLAADYRRLRGVRPGGESPELRLALRQMLNRRERALELLDELGEPVPAFTLSAQLRETPAAVGGRLRQALGIDLTTQLQWTTQWRAWAGWRSAVEQLGVFVFQFPRVDLEEVRGLALLKNPLPVAAVNGKEIPEAKSFTVVHEVVHLMLAAAHEEASAEIDRRPSEDWTRVEQFAETAAGEVLMPDAPLRQEIRSLHLDPTHGIEDMRRLARRFKVTPLAAATRLRGIGVMTWTQYREWESRWHEYVATLPTRKGGFATPVDKALGRAGRPFAQLVVEALDANRITSVDAARYLDLRFSHFDELRAHLAEQGAGAGLDE